MGRTTHRYWSVAGNAGPVYPLTGMRRFTGETDDATLADLQARLDRSRWPDDPDGPPWDHGTDGAYLRELVRYWRGHFDWRAQERALHRFAHFRAEVDGFGVHYIHERSREPGALPLLVTHGWPSSFVEMTKVIPLLTAAGFDVVVPSLPGCGYSDRPRAPMTRTRTAALWARLMTDVLGYPRFVARGGDIGASITTFLGMDHPTRCVAIHLSDVYPPYLGPGSAPLSAAEVHFRAEEEDWMRREGAYDHVQATKPQTLAYALNESPAGLAAWIVEKFRSWSDCGGDVERRFTKDELLTNVTLYWVTQTINSSMRLYFDRAHALREMRADDRVRVPAAFAMFPADIDHPPREYAERTYQVARWTEMPRGGHFAALEEPELLAEDLRDFFREFR
jgi:pimeloyl-ACP methyl ester carboxylesterase